MTPALRWAGMRAILMFHHCEGQSHKTVSTNHNLLKRKESRSGIEPRPFCLPVRFTAGPHRLTDGYGGTRLEPKTSPSVTAGLTVTPDLVDLVSRTTRAGSFNSCPLSKKRHASRGELGPLWLLCEALSVANKVKSKSGLPAL